MSKYHFLRCFSATYGKTPAVYLAQRRLERAQDLLRATNLTVTEVCLLVGYTSLGSFSSRLPARLTSAGWAGWVSADAAVLSHDRCRRTSSAGSGENRGQTRDCGET